MASTKTKTISKEVTTLKTRDDSKALSTGDNWSCGCMAGRKFAKKPPGHDNCQTHKEFMKWLSAHDGDKQKELRALSDKVSAAQSTSRDFENKYIFNSKEFVKYQTWYRNAEDILCNQKRTITGLKKDIEDRDLDLDDKDNEIRVLYENLDHILERKKAKKMSRLN